MTTSAEQARQDEKWERILEARYLKARKMVNTLSSLKTDGPIYADDIAGLLHVDAFWRMLAEAADVRCPSIQTRRLVLTMMRDDAAQAKRAAADTSDPFDGLAF